MVKTMQQTVTLNAPPEALFDTYLDSKKHEAVIDATVSMSRQVGGTFSVFDGGIVGKNLMIAPKRMSCSRGEPRPGRNPIPIHS